MSVRFRDDTTYAPAPPAPAPSEPRRPRAGLHIALLSLLNMPQGWLAFIGFAMAAEAAAGSLVLANWQPGLGGLPMLTAVAIAAAFVISRVPRPRVRWHTLAIVGGCLISVRMVGGYFLPSNLNFIVESGTVLGRLVDWIDTSIMVRIYQDNLLVALAVACYVFSWTYLSYWVAIQWRLGWLASTMLGLTLLGNVEFKPSSAGPFLALWAAGCLLLNLQLALGRQRAYRQVRFGGWRSRQRLAVASGLSVVGLATIAFAFSPAVQINQVLNDLWNHIDGPLVRARQIYNEMGVPRQYDSGEIRGPNFGPQLRFLGPFRPGDELVMKIKADRPRPQQGLVYDHYDHNGWTSTQFDQFDAGANEFLTSTAARTSAERDRVPVTEQIQQVTPKGALLFAAPQPIGASVRLRGDGFGDLRATALVQPNQTYTSNSLESAAPVDALEKASGPIPNDIRSTYLQLPGNLPSRIKDLAVKQTAGSTTEFDKAAAIEAYLRAIPFETEIPPPPPGRDGVDWFLFDEKKGYSDYTASAMAVMLRTLGIPTRVVAGYSPAPLDADGTYHVTEAQTNTWTQVYFPTYGWIDFEPSSVTPLAGRGPRSSGAGVSLSDQATVTPEDTAEPSPEPANAALQQPPPPRQFPWAILLVFPLAAAVFWLALTSRGSRITARLAYARLLLLGRLLGVRPRHWQTPREYGRDLQQRRGFHTENIETITAIYTAARYSPKPLPSADHRRAWRAWQIVRANFVRFWDRF